MPDDKSGTVHSASEKGIAASHAGVEVQPFLVAPTTGKAFNVRAVDLDAVACLSLHDLLFAFDSSFVTADAAEVLKELPGLREQHKNALGYPPLSLFGHADPVGTDVYNKQLSGRRARAVYGLLLNDVSIWDHLYSAPWEGDNWATHNVVGLMRSATSQPSGTPRKDVIAAYMKLLFPSPLQKTDFLGRGADADGVADYQGCSEFNPLVLLSKKENDTLPHEKRNKENQPNRRVVVYLFCPGRKVNVKLWPCPAAAAPPAGCHNRFFADGEKRRKPDAVERREFAKTANTFACRFYDRIAHVSPCEQPPVPVLLGAIRGRVIDMDNADDKTNGVAGATITLDGAPAGALKSGAKGEFEFKSVQPGKHQVTATAMLEYDDGSATADVTPPGATADVVIKVQSVDYHLHVDADRDGKADDDRAGLDKWEWGKGKKGAIIYANNDDDGSRHDPDNTDNKINTGNDPSDVAPLEIRRVGTKDPPAAWEAFLEVAAGTEKFVRVFESRATGAKEIIGPAAGAKFKFKDLKFQTKELGIEAVQYADKNWDGEVVLTFTLNRAGRTTTEQAKFRVAPWMMPNHLDAATRVFVVKNPWNARYRTDLRALVTAAGCTLQEFSLPNDPWMQDCMEIGFSNLATGGMHTVMRNPRNRPLKVFAKTLLKADFGYHEQGSLSPNTTFDSTGNLECTPPAKSAAGKQYPWGRIYFGPGRPLEEMDADVKEFLKKQVVQEPIEIDTNFLAVGHVDEIISFVPAAGGTGFKLLLASPDRAYKILTDNQAAHGSEKMLIARFFPDATGSLTRSAEVTINDFLTSGVLGLTAASIKTFNTSAQGTINSARTKFKSELGIGDADIIDIPSLFIPNEDLPTLADALTAGMVNMLVINSHCIVPKPFGPVVGGKDLFEEDLKASLTPLGLTVNFLDDWEEYHVNLGEVHCSSNTLRSPVQANWWEFVP